MPLLSDLQKWPSTQEWSEFEEMAKKSETDLELRELPVTAEANPDPHP